MKGGALGTLTYNPCHTEVKSLHQPKQSTTEDEPQKGSILRQRPSVRFSCTTCEDRNKTVRNHDYLYYTFCSGFEFFFFFFFFFFSFFFLFFFSRSWVRFRVRREVLEVLEVFEVLSEFFLTRPVKISTKKGNILRIWTTVLVDGRGFDFGSDFFFFFFFCRFFV